MKNLYRRFIHGFRFMHVFLVEINTTPTRHGYGFTFKITGFLENTQCVLAICVPFCGVPQHFRHICHTQQAVTCQNPVTHPHGLVKGLRILSQCVFKLTLNEKNFAHELIADRDAFMVRLVCQPQICTVSLFCFQ